MEEVTSLASSRGSSNSPDAVDIATVMSAFQGINRVTLDVKLTVTDNGAYSHLMLEATATDCRPLSGDQKRLDSLSVKRPWNAPQSMEAAILQLLYALDFQLGDREMRGKDSAA